MPNPIMRFFQYGHLPAGTPREMSHLCSEVAVLIEEALPDSAEKSAGLRKLLEAKDCFVRAALPE